MGWRGLGIVLDECGEAETEDGKGDCGRWESGWRWMDECGGRECWSGRRYERSLGGVCTMGFGRLGWFGGREVGLGMMRLDGERQKEQDMRSHRWAEARGIGRWESRSCYILTEEKSYHLEGEDGHDRKRTEK